MKKHYERIYAAIDLDAISHNMNIIAQKISPKTQMIAVVKTDGYGHGAVPIAKELEEKEFMYGFATATAEEAFILRKAGIKKPILVLGYVFPYTYEQMIKDDIRFTVFREDMLALIEEEAAKQKARETYEKLIDLCRDNPDVLDPLRFLRQREVVHFQRFGEALRGVQDKLAEKKFYMANCTKNICDDNNCGC